MTKNLALYQFLLQHLAKAIDNSNVLPHFCNKPLWINCMASESESVASAVGDVANSRAGPEIALHPPQCVVYIYCLCTFVHKIRHSLPTGPPSPPPPFSALKRAEIRAPARMRFAETSDRQFVRKSHAFCQFLAGIAAPESVLTCGQSPK